MSILVQSTLGELYTVINPWTFKKVEEGRYRNIENGSYNALKRSYFRYRYNGYYISRFFQLLITRIISVRSIIMTIEQQNENNENIRPSAFGSRQCLPAPLDHEVIIEALRELDAGQRNFVLNCVESFQVKKVFLTLSPRMPFLLKHNFDILDWSSVFIRFDSEHPAFRA